MIRITHREPTPNAAAWKFVTDTELVKSGALSFENAEQAEAQDVAKRIFAMGGINSVYIQANFVSVNAQDGADWDKIEATVQEGLTFFTPVDGAASDGDAPADGDDMLTKVNATIDQYVRPALAGDGGGLEVLGVNGKTVTIRYQGACGGCPSAKAGTMYAIQNLLQDQVDPSITVDVL